jgi:TPP-dependent pyruvate/acetoin dehydrogenase alpha subunit
VVLTPGPKERMYARLGESMRRAAVKVHVPHLPVDAGDALAIYRVMQESVGRARGDSRGVVIECIACGVDPVAMMGGQLVKKGICTERWVAAVEADFRRRF